MNNIDIINIWLKKSNEWNGEYFIHYPLSKGLPTIYFITRMPILTLYILPVLSSRQDMYKGVIAGKILFHAMLCSCIAYVF